MASRQPYFEIRRSPIQGRGAFALRRIRAGTRIDTGLLLPGESTIVIFSAAGTYEVVDLTPDPDG